MNPITFELEMSKPQDFEVPGVGTFTITAAPAAYDHVTVTLAPKDDAEPVAEGDAANG